MKKERTRADIERVAAEMFAERGFEAVTVDEIAAEAQVSHRTFYRYFASKEDLVLGSSHERIDQLVEAFRRRPTTESVAASLRSVVMALASEYEHDLEHDRVRAAIVLSTPALQDRERERQAAFEAAIVPVIAERLESDASDLRPALIAGCAVTAIRVAMASWLARGADEPLVPIVEHALTVVATAFDDVR